MKKSKSKLMAVPFAVMTTMMLATSVFAAEPPEVVQAEKEPVLESISPSTKTAAQLQVENLNSNNDVERRAALEKEFNIELSESDVWQDKEGEYTYSYGIKQEYTSHKAQKSLGIYAVNANRQELIQYALRTNDWQPYRTFEAKKAPLHFELVDGKYEYSKIYWGQYIGTALAGFNEMSVKTANDPEKRQAVEVERKAFIEEYAKIFNEAPGEVPYVVHFNNSEKIAEMHGVPQVAKDFYNSKYNHPDVMAKGAFATETATSNTKQ